MQLINETFVSTTGLGVCKISGTIGQRKRSVQRRRLTTALSALAVRVPYPAARRLLVSALTALFGSCLPFKYAYRVLEIT